MMKRLTVMIGLLGGLVVPLGAQWSYTKTLADVTVAGTAISVFTASDVQAGNGHAAATLAQCTLSTANIRVTTDGTVPTSTLGLLLTPGQYTITGAQVLLNLQAIRTTSTSGVLSCVLYGQ